MLIQSHPVFQVSIYVIFLIPIAFIRRVIGYDTLKLKKKHSVISLWDKTKKLAVKEGKTPVIALCEKERPGFWIMVHSDDLEKVSDIVKKK